MSKHLAGQLALGAVVAIVALTPGCGVGAGIGALLALSSKSSSKSTFAAPPPSVTAISPASGTHAGGTIVTLSGSNFGSAASVAVGGVAATNVVVASSTQITATTARYAGTGAVDVVVSDPSTGSATLSRGFTYTNTPPTATIGTISSPQSGNIVIGFTLADPESDLADVTLEVDVGRGFQTIPSQAILSGGLLGLTTSPAGTAHTIAWASGSTYGSQDFSSVRVRITPTDETDKTVGVAGISNSFGISNNAPVTLALSQPAKGSFDIPIPYTVSDLDSGETVSVTSLRWQDLLTGRSGNLTVKSGQGVGTCGYSAAGTLATSLWDSLADLGYGNDQLVTVTVSVSDSKSQATQTTQPFFVSNGPLSEATDYPNTLPLAAFAVGDISGDTRPDIVGCSPQQVFPGDITFILNRGIDFAQLAAVQPPSLPNPTLKTQSPIPGALPVNTFLYNAMHPTEAAILDVNGDKKLDYVVADSINSPYNELNLLTNTSLVLNQAVADVSSNFVEFMAHQNTLVALQSGGLPNVTGGTFQSTQAAQSRVAPIVRIGTLGPAAGPNLPAPGAPLFGQNMVSTFPQAATGDNSYDYIGWIAQQVVAADLDPPGSPGRGSLDLVVLHGWKQLGAARNSSDFSGAVVIRPFDPNAKTLSGGTTSSNFYLDPTDMGQIPTMCAVADIDSTSHAGTPFNFQTGAGSPDIVVANTRDDSLTFYLQYAAAQYPAGSPIVPPTYVSFNLPMQTVMNMIAPAITLPAGDTNGIAIADLNGDGSNDFVVTGAKSKTAVFFIYDPNPASANSLVTLTNGLLPFRVAGYVTFPHTGAGRPTLADLSGDGRVDLAVAGGLSNTLLVYLNQGNDAAGNPVFATTPIQFAAGQQPFAAIALDLNRDGRADVVVGNKTTADMSVFYQTSPGTLNHTPVPVPTGVTPTDLAAGDCTGDGTPKLACAMYGDNALWVFGRGGNALLSPLRKYDLGVQGGIAPDSCQATGPHTVAMARTRNTGPLDILVAMEKVSMGTAVGAPAQPGGLTDVGGFEVILGASTLPSTVAAVVTGAANPLGTSVACGKFLTDGNPDIVLTESGQNGPAVNQRCMSFYDQVAGVWSKTLTTQVVYGTADQGPTRIVCVDMDGDGLPDLVLAHGDSTSMYIYYNGESWNGNNPPTFTAIAPGTFGNPYVIKNPFGSVLGRVTDVTVADVDGDGRQDIVFSGNTTAAAGIYFQTATHVFTAVPLDCGDEPGQIAVGDLNGDGLLDIAIPWGGDNLVAVYYQNPAKTGPSDTYFGPVTLTTAATPTGCAILDADGDGRNDVVVSCRGANALNVFLQR